MKQALFILFTDLTDEKLDDEIERIKHNALRVDLFPQKIYIALKTQNGISETDAHEIEYYLNSHPEISYVEFCLEIEDIRKIEPFARKLVDEGYIVLFNKIIDYLSVIGL